MLQNLDKLIVKNIWIFDSRKPASISDWCYVIVFLLIYFYLNCFTEFPLLSYQDKDFVEECKEEYLKRREDFQKQYAQSGQAADFKKKDSVIM